MDCFFPPPVLKGLISLTDTYCSPLRRSPVAEGHERGSEAEWSVGRVQGGQQEDSAAQRPKTGVPQAAPRHSLSSVMAGEVINRHCYHVRIFHVIKATAAAHDDGLTLQIYYIKIILYKNIFNSWLYG